jgi:hypothetical protein
MKLRLRTIFEYMTFVAFLAAPVRFLGPVALYLETGLLMFFVVAFPIVIAFLAIAIGESSKGHIVIKGNPVLESAARLWLFGIVTLAIFVILACTGIFTFDDRGDEFIDSDF